MNKLDPRTTRRLVGTLAASAVLAGGTAAGAQAAPAHRSNAPAPQVQQWRATHRSTATAPRTATASRAASTTAYRTSTTTYRMATASTTTASTTTSSSTTSATGTNSGGGVTYSSTTSISTAGLSANAVKVLKVIIEAAALTDDEVVRACRAAEEAGADFVKTSTGFHAAGGASVHAVELMARTVGGRLGVKASGGIRDWDTAVQMVEAGATRLGVSASKAILDGAPA